MRMPNMNGKYGESFRKNRFIEIKQFLAEIGYTLHETEYVNNRTPMSVECNNGHKYPATWDNLRQGKLCRECYLTKVQTPVVIRKQEKQTRKKLSQEQKHEVFKTAVEAEGYVLHPGEYVNNQSKFDVTCPEDHTYPTTWNRWQSGQRCRECFEKRVRKSTEDIAAELAAEGCELIGEYNGSNKRFKYKCVCGTLAYGRIKDFRNGVRCKFCAGEKTRETNRLKRLEKLKQYDLEHPEEVQV